MALLVLDNRDNVAVALRDLEPGERVCAEGCALVVRGHVPQGHKIAFKAIRKGEAVIKYGLPVGRASMPIVVGEHVHMHNVASIYLDNAQNNTR